jgi:hypothetical protein
MRLYSIVTSLVTSICINCLDISPIVCLFDWVLVGIVEVELRFVADVRFLICEGHLAGLLRDHLLVFLLLQLLFYLKFVV